MRDIFADDARHWQWILDRIRSVLVSNTYEEIRLPLLEYKELFSRSVGEATDIVEKEMYNLTDRDGGEITLRPEGTAGCVRALIENGLIYNQTQRVFYAGEMFRYERPQKGRYRQFSQIGAETFGMAGPEIDLELITLVTDIWDSLLLTDALSLEINNLGSPESRASYRNALLKYLKPLSEKLDVDSQNRIETNPLRILDSKDLETQKLLEKAPVLADFVDSGSTSRFAELCRVLTDLGVEYKINPRLVRGLDYYTDTVFEWTTDQLGAQGTLCGGGRYDGLVELLGGQPTPAAGFAIGLDRVALLHKSLKQEKQKETPSEHWRSSVDIYVCSQKADMKNASLRIANQLRHSLDGIRVRSDLTGSKLRSQMKRADQYGSRIAIILGAEELKSNQVTMKYLHGEFPQKTAAFETIIADLRGYFSLE